MFVKRAVDEQGIPFDVKANAKPLNPVYQKLITEENAKILGLTPDDATPLDNDFYKKAVVMYK